jgi:hypothetical protein
MSMESEIEIKDELKLNNPIDDISNIMKVAKGTVKIELDNDKGVASGFFLKLERNNKEFYCLMTNAHVITKKMITNQEKIKIKYDNETKEINLELNEKERIIFCFMDFGIDITIIEIIPKDGIKDKTYFLNPNTDKNYEEFIGKNIQIIQFPDGKKLSKSEQKITERFTKIDYMFYHNASTIEGSSGSPIILKDDDKVLGIHKGGIRGKKKNVGIFIGIIFEAIKEYKRNGEGKDYYEDGKIKYEGNFVDDEYDDEKGKFYDESGNKYEGKFTKGKKNGDFSIYDKEGELIHKNKYEDDKLIEKTDINNSNNNNNNNGNIIINHNSLHDLLGALYEISKPIADKYFDMYLCDCGHGSEFHTQIKSGEYKYKCSKCPEDSGLCHLK